VRGLAWWGLGDGNGWVEMKGGKRVVVMWVEDEGGGVGLLFCCVV